GRSPSPSMIVADTSWPGIRGKDTSGFNPRKEFKSLPQNPTIRTFNNSSPGPTTGSGMASIDAWPGFCSRSAFMVEQDFREHAIKAASCVLQPSVFHYWSSLWPEAVSLPQHSSSHTPVQKIPKYTECTCWS